MPTLSISECNQVHGSMGMVNKFWIYPCTTLWFGKKEKLITDHFDSQPLIIYHARMHYQMVEILI